jgi:cell division initiation protein
MNVSPLDLRQQRFRNAFLGFDKIEVTALLMAVADDYELAVRESDRLRHELVRMEAALAEHREHEKSLKFTLLAAQKVADDLRANAEEEARRLVQDAQARSELLFEQAQSRIDTVHRDIENLKLSRRQVETSIESTIQTLRTTLEFVRDQDVYEREDKILLHRPRSNDDTQAADSRAVDLQDVRASGLHEAKAG